MKRIVTTHMKNKTRAGGICRTAALSAAFLLALASAGHADPYTYAVTIDVSSLTTDANGPYSLDLQLVQGSDNVNNSVNIYNLSAVGGSFTSTPVFTTGGASGSVAGGVVLTNSASDNEVAYQFSSTTTQITFSVTESNNQELVGGGTPTPDQFNIAILDNTAINPIATTDPSGNDALVSHAMEGTQGISQLELFSSTGVDGNGGVTAIPEPGSTTMAAIGAGLLALLAWRRKASRFGFSA